MSQNQGFIQQFENSIAKLGQINTMIQKNAEQKNKFNGLVDVIKLAGRGTNNIKIVMLTYTCAKLLCMISKTPKADVIRKFYIEICQRRCSNCII
jgi:hypothetical protein